MDIHYNAFISYRHHPDDIQVAEQIHKGLERFKVPKSIKKRSAPMRLFRDKEELPITSHLTDDIGNALENSDFLIVICSPHTKESVWVQREIETFLKTHSRDKVLTVLAAGEPYDVIPDILLHEDVLDPITGQIVRREIEPLSCDWRLKKRKAVREELPRLAAPLLGCAYDELRQRQRQYRMRRTIAFFSAALVASVSLMIYFIHTSIQIQRANDDLHAANVQIQAANVKIQDNLDRALRNQSEYLASAADTKLDDGDRLTAIALALEALPSEDNVRPYVAAAEHALSDALNSYQSSEQVTAQGTYTADTLAEDFVLSEDGSTIYVRDARNVVTVWDTESFQKLHTIDISKYNIQSMYLTPRENLILCVGYTGDEVVCVDLNGQELWREETGQEVAFLDERSVVMILDGASSLQRQLLFLNPDTGKQVREPLSLELGEDGAYAGQFLQLEYQTGQPVILEYYDSSNHYVALLDLQTDTIRFVKTIDTSFSGANQWIDTAGVIQDGNVVVMCGDGSGFYNGRYGSTETTGMDRADVWCFDGKTGRELWQTEIITYVYTNTSTVEPIPNSNWILLQNGNTFQVCDSLTGETIAQCQSPALPLCVNVGETSTNGILGNGDFFSFSYADNRCLSSSFLDGTVDLAVANHGIFVHTPLSSQITAYWTELDEEGVQIDCELAYSTRFHQMFDEKLAIKTYDYLFMLDAVQQKLLWRYEVGSAWEVLGFGADGNEFWMWNQNDDYAVAISLEDDTDREVPLPADLGDLYTIQESNMYMAGDRLLYILKNQEAMHLLQMDLQTGEILTELPLDALVPEEMSYSRDSAILLATENYIWLYREGGSLYVVDLQSGNIKQLAEGLLLAPPVVYSPDYDQVLVGIDHELRLTTPGGALIRGIDLGDVKAVSMYFYNQELLALCDDGTLYRYDRKGNQLSQTSLNIFDTFASSITTDIEDPADLAWWVTDDGDLILNVYQAGNIVDCESWQARAFVPYLSTYVPQNDTLLCLTNKYLYAYPRYTMEQQMARGLEVLGGFQLTEEQRAYYGLN